MATDVLDERRFSSQCSIYEPSTRTRLTHEGKSRTTATSSTTLFEPTSKSNVTSVRRVRYSTQTSVSINNSTTTNSVQHRHSVSNDLITVIRSFALKPFKTSSMTHAIAEGQTSNIIGGNQTHTRPPVSLLRYRPLSENVSNHSSFVQSTRQIEDFLKRMGWPMDSTTDEARVKWNTAMKFLIPVKFDVNRAMSLYRSHETIRKNENLDRIWINNPLLAREIQSNKFFTLEQLPNQPLTACFTAAHLLNATSSNASSESDRELIALQALICQLDVATESVEVQQRGLNFIYDMQTCSASQFEMNLSKKILKLLQGSYPAMVKNIFIISAPKWFKIAYKVAMYTPDQMRDVLINQFGYSFDNIPISLGGSFNPSVNGDSRYQTCLAVVTNFQSICHSYYSPDYQPMTTKSSSNILFFNADHHHHHHPKTPSVTTADTTTSSSPRSLVAIVALRRNRESSQHRAPKRESSSSNDSEKRRRSNESLIGEELPTYIPQESSFE